MINTIIYYLIIVFCTLSFFVFRFLISKLIKNNRRENEQISDYRATPFSGSDYYKRKEKFLLDLELERESQEEYLITLYFGNDGLQLNKDGTFEWVKRREVKQEAPQTYSSLANIFNPINTQCQNTQATLDALLASETNLLLQEAQIRQTQNMLNGLQSMTNQAPCYASTYQYAPWGNYGGCGSGVPTVILDSGCAYTNIGG